MEQYNPVMCEHKLPNGFTAWQFQSEEGSNLGGSNKVVISVCSLCGEISIGGHRPSKDEKQMNYFHETFNICHPDAIDAIIKQANFYNEEAKWSRITQPPSDPAVNWDQVKINFDAGMPELEASFQAGYSAGVEFEQKRKASAPAIEETKNEIWRNSILNLQGREKEFYDMLRYCLNDEELALGYCSSFESIAKKYDTSATQVAVWAKASDRLPEPFKVVPCKYTPDSPDPRKDTELHWGFVSKEGNWDRGWKHHQVEWLDESPPSSKESDAVEFLEWMWQNRWFDRDDKYWYYTFEQGTYISKKAYNKDYRKTTKELYKIFKQSKINNEKEKD